jgi:hypothetical protein
MDPKNNFFNSRPSIITNNEAERADNLATTDDELELGDNKIVIKANRKGEKLITNTNDAGEKELFDPGADEEA